MTRNRHRINVINASDRTWKPGNYLLWFGAHAPTYTLVYANGLDDALETAAEWLAEHAPGNLTSEDEMTDLYREACDEIGVPWPVEDWNGPFMDKVRESAEADMTYTEAGWLTSYEWGIVGEDMTPAEIAAFAHDREVRR